MHTSQRTEIKTRFGTCRLVRHARGTETQILGIPGIPGGPRDFLPLAQALMSDPHLNGRVGLQVITLPDQLHTHLRLADSQRHLHHLCTFMEDVFEFMGPPKVHVMGHSFGGALALMIAARFPEQVASYMGINPVGVQRHPALTLPPHIWKKLYKPLFVTLEQFSAPLVRYAWTQRGIPAMDKITDDDVKKAVDWVGALNFKWQRWAARRLECPALIMGARNDRLIPPPYTHGLYSALSKERYAQLKMRARGGHTLLMREPLWVKDTLCQFGELANLF
jgi:pimeloyl-ACP methyl ester carboxylesterase